MWETIKDLISTRGVQLIARYSGVGITALATKFSMEVKPEDADGFSKVIAVFIVGGICFAIDHFSHAKQADEK